MSSFSNPFPVERLDFKSKKSEIGLNQSNPSSEWVQWIRNPFLDLPEGIENPIFGFEIRIGF